LSLTAALTDGNPDDLVAPLRRRLAELAPSFALDWIGPMDQLIMDLFLRDTRFVLSLLGVFALIGLFLSATGLFAVLADSVARRRAEIGLRQALGASPKRVLASTLGDAVGVVALGMGLGSVLAWVWRQAIASMLYGVSPNDPWSHASALGVMALVAVLAAVAPSLRAAAIEPADALRDG
jgi:putative ABC transport system permease protein